MKNNDKRNERAKQFDNDYVDFINQFKTQLKIEMIHNEMTFNDIAERIGMTHNGLMFGLNFHREMSVTTLLKIANVMNFKITID